ncbi:hypothetical protein D0T49_06635 [Paludibacter sp. 221]|uniref:DUF6377 domain-containing protein n=1 Tax=Paludibacter sp. 221 TaxID=2302939 RepID=UPI0013D7404C|nr:DUF6377 domain-containing protein [Paludibacter sp. 221]NDV46721.1 hypothetical protein [Paludibacter sp. 221]
MRNSLILLCAFLPFVSLLSQKSELSSLFALLDSTIQNKEIYVEQKEARINELKKILKLPNVTSEQIYRIHTDLQNEYLSFIPDSAKKYARENLQIAEELNNEDWILESKLMLIQLYSKAGLYLDALDILNSINRPAIPEKFLTHYYSACKQFYYNYLSGNVLNNQPYLNYQDSLFVLTKEGSRQYKYALAEKLMDTGEWAKAREILLPIFDETEDGSHLQAMMAYWIGCTYRGENDYAMQKKYFVISAIADMKNAVKEHESFLALAVSCYETNETERAYKYVYQSMEDAVFANLSMKTLKVSQFFPIIEKAYNDKIQEQNGKLAGMLFFIGILSVILIIIIVFVIIQLGKLAKARRHLSETNTRLKSLNDDMVRTNNALSEANLLKETYIGEFLNICSVYIKKLEKYQHSINKMVIDRQFEELAKSLRSRDMLEEELKNLYDIFDKVFLRLYPGFVEEFNKLLPEDERFNIKNNDSLNTELRVFALIRLGITDSTQIAEFLRCSIRTVYNYRTRIRNKSFVNKDDFENEVMKIGANFSK